MAVTISGGGRQTNNTWQSSETLTQSTATSFQSLSTRIEVSVLGMGTATGFSRNLYTLGSATSETSSPVEGQEKLIICSATGEAKLFVAGPTQGRLPLHVAFENNPTATAVDALLASATGLWTFQTDGDYLLVKYMNGVWNYLDSKGATLATST